MLVPERSRRCGREWSMVDNTSIRMAPASTFYCFPVNSAGDLPRRCNAERMLEIAGNRRRCPALSSTSSAAARVRGHNSPSGCGYRKIPIVRERHIRTANTSLGRVHRRRCQIRSVFDSVFRESERSRTAGKIDRRDYGYFGRQIKLFVTVRIRNVGVPVDAD